MTAHAIFTDTLSISREAKLRRLEQREAQLAYRKMLDLMHRLPGEQIVDLVRCAANDRALAGTDPAIAMLDACDELEAEWRTEDARLLEGRS